MLTPTGKLVLVLFRVRVVRASGRGEAAWACEAMCFCPPPPVGFRILGLGLFLLLYARVLRNLFKTLANSEGFKRYL